MKTRSSGTQSFFNKTRKLETFSLSKRSKINLNNTFKTFLTGFFNFLWSICVQIIKYLMAANEKEQIKPITKKPNVNRKSAGSNWQNAVQNDELPKKPSNKGSKRGDKSNQELTKFVAMDCEMVGVGLDGAEDMLARVSIVNQSGNVLLDKYVKPREKVIDYRTSISGIRPHDIENAEDFDKVQDDVVNILQGNILVGHAVSHDLAVLFIKHPFKYIRDTSKYRPLAKLVSNGATPSLKRLSKAILDLDIQNGEHSSVEDAKATMAIYNRFSADWEKYIKKLLQRQNCNRPRHGRKS